MAEFDDYLDQEEWDTDASSVEQDQFNTTDFGGHTAVEPQAPEIVKGSEKPEYTAITLPPAASPEVNEAQEQKELAQAREAPKVTRVTPPAVAAAPKAKRGTRKLPDLGTAPKYGNGRKPSAVRKVSVNNAGKVIDQAFAGAGKYSQELIEFFSEMNQKSLTQQAIEYLNAYWSEVGDQAEFIFSVTMKVFREADMHRQGISLHYMYEEGSGVDYPTYLYFYEKLVRFMSKNPKWRDPEWEKSQVYEVKTAVKHKQELKEKVDISFDGEISFLEFLLYQYNVYSNPMGFMERSKISGEEHPTVRAARLALEEVNMRIKEYEAERARLMKGAENPGVKGLTFKHQLTMLDVSPLSEQLNKALITAEAAVRLAVRRFGGSTIIQSTGGNNGTPQGALWWMQRDLAEKKRVIVPKTLRRMKK